MFVISRTAEKYSVNSVDKAAATSPSGGLIDSKPVSFFYLFRFATCWEICLVLLAILFAAISATMMPLIIITYGEFTTILVERAYKGGVTSNTTLLHFFDGGRSL